MIIIQIKDFQVKNQCCLLPAFTCLPSPQGLCPLVRQVLAVPRAPRHFSDIFPVVCTLMPGITTTGESPPSWTPHHLGIHPGRLRQRGQSPLNRHVYNQVTIRPLSTPFCTRVATPPSLTSPIIQPHSCQFWAFEKPYEAGVEPGQWECLGY